MTTDDQSLLLKLFDNPEPVTDSLWYVKPEALLKVAKELIELRQRTEHDFEAAEEAWMRDRESKT